MSDRVDLDPSDRQVCEIYSRVMGYHRPVQYWNTGKQSEFRERQPFREPSGLGSSDARA
jgi:hypothetical protein